MYVIGYQVYIGFSKHLQSISIICFRKPNDQTAVFGDNIFQNVMPVPLESSRVLVERADSRPQSESLDLWFLEMMPMSLHFKLPEWSL